MKNMTEEKSIISQRMRNLRIEKKVTQTELGKILYCHKDVYRRYENGTHHPPSQVIRRLAMYYKISADYLLGIIDDERPIE